MLTKTHRFISVQIALVLLVTAFISMPVHAKVVMAGNEVQVGDGELDTTFGTGGIVTTDFSDDFDFGSSVVLQPDGKIVVVGWSFIDDAPKSDFVLARYMPDGSLDPTFDSDGKVITSFASQDDAYAVALQADGKILLAGTIDMSVFALVRYNSNGSLDTTFDNDGIVTTALGLNVNGSAYAIAVQPDDKIVLAGQRWSSPDSDFALVRYNNDGSLDAGFGGNGIVTTDFGTHAVGNAIVIQPSDGKIIVAGESGNTDNKSITLARYNSDGSLDTTFDSDGKVITSLGINDIAEDLTLQPDGKILAAGSGENSGGDQDFVLARYNSDGSLDTTFGLDGRVLTDFGSREYGRAVAVQPDGRILMTGAGNDRTTLVLARYQSNGALDTSFGVNGKVFTSGPDVIVGFDLALQPDRNIIVVGGCVNGNNADFMVARYIYHAAPATTLTVTKTADTNDGICDLDCSLREAIVSSFDGDVIRFDSSLAGKTITLTSTLVIDKDLTIDASSLASKIVISGDNSVTIFLIVSPAAVTLDSLVITKGYSPADAGGIYNDGTLSLLHSDVIGNSGPSGAGIRNGGTVNLVNSNISTNVGNFGGGVDNRGSLNITNSTVSGNIADQGAGIMNSYGSVTVVNSTFSGNHSTVTAGGAIVNDAGTLRISGSTFSSNAAATEGGAIFNNFGIAMEVSDSTFSGNSALFGGAIENVGSTLSITDSSFVENLSGDDLGNGGGAGIYNLVGSTLNVTNTTFSENRTTGSGAGIANGSDSTAVLDHVTFLGNEADAGAAISSSGNMTVTSSQFTANVASSIAGGIYLSGSLEMKDSTLSNNSAEGDAGGLFIYSSSPILTNVTFTGNSAKTGAGGGLVNYLNSNPVLDHVIFDNNSAVSGGGISNVNSNLTLTNGIFIHNSASRGGGMHSLGTSSPKLTGVTFQGNLASTDGGGLYNDEKSTPSLTNVTFQNNSAASKGGGVYNFIGSDPSLIHVTLSGNTAGAGGGIYNDLESSLTLINSIVWGNSGGEITNFMSTPVVRYSIVQGGYPGTGNLDQDPLLGPLQNNGGFTETMALLPGSPAIDAGTNAGCPTIDQRGASRPQGERCDVGAFEYEFPPAPTELIITSDSPDPSVIESWVTVSVVVSNIGEGGAQPTGVVHITGADANCDITLNNGTGSCDVRFDTAGDKVISAFYQGDDSHLASSDEQSHSVQIWPTTLTILSDLPDPSVKNGSFSVAVQVTGGGIPPTGTVTVVGDGVSCTIPLSMGKGSCLLSFGTIGQKTLTATYSGDSLHLPSTDTEFHQVLQGTPTVPLSPAFADVPVTHPYYQDIEILYANGLTGGCSTNPLKYCPDQTMNRGEAAVFILRANFGSSYVLPVSTHIFQDDWSKGPWAEPWADAMWTKGLSGGCQTNPPKYCPWDQIPREQAVIFVLRMKYGTSYMPPPATGTVFADMTDTGYYATSWAEQAYKDGLIPNCGMSGGKPKFCPKNVVSRGLAAYMIVRAKNLTMP